MNTTPVGFAGVLTMISFVFDVRARRSRSGFDQQRPIPLPRHFRRLHFVELRHHGVERVGRIEDKRFVSRIQIGGERAVESFGGASRDKHLTGLPLSCRWTRHPARDRCSQVVVALRWRVARIAVADRSVLSVADVLRR